MKVLVGDIITNVVASSTTTGFPASNVEDKHPKKQWKAVYGITNPTLTISVPTVSSSYVLAMFGVECASATVTPSGGSPEAITFYTSPYTGLQSCWHQLVGSGTGSFVITFTKASTGWTKAGVLKYALLKSFRTHAEGLAEGSIDYSIIKELSNGATYFKKRDIVRIFNCQMLHERSASDYYDFMNNVVRELGPDPAAWLVTDVNDEYWTVFARINDVQSSHAYIDRTITSIELIEAL